ncbi:hypothetical protein OHQ89_52085 [Streptomyces canus]
MTRYCVNLDQHELMAVWETAKVTLPSASPLCPVLQTSPRLAWPAL